MTPLTVVSNRLPVRLVRGVRGVELRPSDGGLVSALRPVLRERGGAWVGWSGTPGAPGEEGLAALDAFARGEGYALRPVPLSEREHEDFYEGACNRVLWPLLHGFAERSEPRPGDAGVYADVNRLFAEVAAEGRPDTVWVHDYHLLSIGEELRRRLPHGRLGFFLHIPFPSPEVLLRLSWGADLLPSLAAFDVVGFQTEHDRRNFLDWARRLSRRGWTGSTAAAAPGPSPLESRTGVYRISVDWRRYHDEAGSPEVVARAEEIRADAGGRRILLGVDRLDYSKGIPQRLRAYAHLLEAAPELRGTVTFVQLAVPSRTGIAEYDRTRAEIEALVASVNERFGAPGWTPIRYLYGTWSHTELLAWYVAADAAVVTPLRDGMNLVAKEFCAANRGGGSLVLSRGAGAAEELADSALLVNPGDTRDLAAALRAALAMPAAEREARIRRAQEHLRRHDVHAWAASFLRTLESPRLTAPPRAAPRALPPGRRSSSGGHASGVA